MGTVGILRVTYPGSKSVQKVPFFKILFKVIFKQKKSQILSDLLKGKYTFLIEIFNFLTFLIKNNAFWRPFLCGGGRDGVGCVKNWLSLTGGGGNGSPYHLYPRLEWTMGGSSSFTFKLRIIQKFI